MGLLGLFLLSTVLYILQVALVVISEFGHRVGTLYHLKITTFCP